MSFQPNPNDELTIGGKTYRVARHPAAPGIAHGQEGRAGIVYRLLASIPPGKLRFSFFDPVGLGQSVVPFMSLADYDEGLVIARAWSKARRIEQRLTDLTEHIETVIQKYLRTEYAGSTPVNRGA